MADDENEKDLLSCGWEDSSFLGAPCRLLDRNDCAPGDREALPVPPSTLFSFMASFPDAALPFPALLVNERNGKNLFIFQDQDG